MARPRRGQTDVVDDSEVDKTEVESQEEEGDDEGYIVEKLMNVKKIGKSGGFQYLVRWEGYEAADDTWEPEENVQSAPAAITQFWKTHSKLMDKYNVTSDGQPRTDKPSAATSTQTKAGRASAARGAKANGKESSHTTPTVSRTRIRPLTDSPPVSPPHAPETRTSAAQTARKRKRDSDDDDEELQTMTKHMKTEDWESIVERVSDVTRGRGKARNTLIVTLELSNGSSSTSTNIECNKRCPQKMLAFYESKIRFSEVDA
ncbi:hypothetical protein CALCODRAFT_489741 [Calocera cornea HHB12733]|uniref:Chromo domain-containing protein n=1 Tax=Calocera cornea HHB12733 TaxID=1353952 RepID=A0A165JXP7_9BASI|nr:hypothetical protein CALCODRAFT_489741 [Calocera cornea HHB12733]